MEKSIIISMIIISSMINMSFAQGMGSIGGGLIGSGIFIIGLLMIPIIIVAAIIQSIRLLIYKKKKKNTKTIHKDLKRILMFLGITILAIFTTTILG